MQMLLKTVAIGEMRIQIIQDWIDTLRRKHPRPALNDLDRKLEKYLNFRDGFFIEAGANNGLSQSNTYVLEKQKGWHGLLVEGIPDLYERCKQERPQSTVVNCALVSSDHVEPTVTMHFANLMSVVDGSLKTNQGQQQHLQSACNSQSLDDSYSVEVPARTLESVLDDLADLPRIDFFSLDVEGYELNVLQGLNFNKYRPTYILVEARFFDEVNEYLESQDYKLVEKMTVHDYLYYNLRDHQA